MTGAATRRKIQEGSVLHGNQTARPAAASEKRDATDLLNGKDPKGADQADSSGGERSGNAAMVLLQLQADMRKARSLTELGYFIANESRALLRAQQIIVFEGGTARAPRVHTVSSMTTVDRASPLVLWLEAVLNALRKSAGLDKVHEFEAAAFGAEFASAQNAYPLPHLLWVPWITGEGRGMAGMLLARSSPWGEHEIRIAQYLAGAFAHAWNAFPQAQTPRTLVAAVLRRKLLLCALIVAVLLVPVPMTALAPVEVVPRETSIVTPGVEGVVAAIHVEPNGTVKSGQLLVSLSDTIARNRAEIAERDVLVAQSRYKKSTQLAFVDPRGRHEMAIARSELDLKIAERDYAKELLGRTAIRAERDGVAFFADKKDLVGKPVVVGEKLMEVANPEVTEFRIELPVSDAIVINDGARVKVFLDSDPLNPVEARLVRAAYKAVAREAQQFSFRLVAEAADPGQSKLRLGVRGTAQVFSDQVPFGFYLLRRPIAAARQWLGI